MDHSGDGQLAYVVSRKDGATLQTNYPVPVPGHDEALIRVLIAGVCNTDLEIMQGYADFSGVLGHEFVGIVERAPPNHESLIGQRVVGEINITCGACTICETGGAIARNHCKNRKVVGIRYRNGTYCQYLVLPVRNLFTVPDSIRSENAAFVEPLAAAIRVIEQGVVNADDRVAVVGDGKLGLLLAEALGRHVKRQRPILFGRHRRKLALVSDVARVETRLVSEALPSCAAHFDVVVDATGNPDGLEISRQLCRPLGTLVLKTTCALGSSFNTAPFVIHELRVVGSRCGPYEPALRMLAEGLDLSPLIEATFPLEQVDQAVEAAGTKGALKVQIRCSMDS